MTITKEEKIISYTLKDPRVPIGTVEGFYRGERAVFLCLIDQDELTQKVDITPVAMLLRDDDIKHVSRPENPDGSKTTPKIIVPN